MKVAQLLEADEWHNDRMSLTQLYKYQLAACYNYLMTAKSIGFYQTNTDLMVALKNEKSDSSMFDLMIKSINKFMDTQGIKDPKWYKHMKAVSDRFDEMLRAKKRYQDSGGSYDGWK